jgi:membrane-associated phospholipid phosphatase
MKTMGKCVVLFTGLLFLASVTPFRTAEASDSPENAGSIIRTLIPAVAYGTTWYLHDREGRIQFYKSFFTNLGATYTLKALVDKTRPDGSDNESFPSGHSSVAFQGAAFIHRRYGFRYAIPAYLGATFVAWSRVESDNHYTVDVVAGAAIGIASSFIFTRPWHGFVVTPMADNGFYGIGISKQW